MTDAPGPDHLARQRDHFEMAYASGSRSHVGSNDPLVKYLVEWRLRKALARVLAARDSISKASSVLVMCAGEGGEGSVLADMGWTDVTVSDLAPSASEAAQRRDPRLKTLVVNAEDTGLESRSFDVVLVQDGLHHLQSPVRGFTEMLRLARHAVVFNEPHDSVAGRTLGTEWEVNGSSTNYVFRWTKSLVAQVTSSYLGHSQYLNLSLSYWHHNVKMERLARATGAKLGLPLLRVLRALANRILGPLGNQMSGIVIRLD